MKGRLKMLEPESAKLYLACLCLPCAPIHLLRPEQAGGM